MKQNFSNKFLAGAALLATLPAFAQNVVAKPVSLPSPTPSSPAPRVPVALTPQGPITDVSPLQAQHLWEKAPEGRKYTITRPARKTDRHHTK